MSGRASDYELLRGIQNSLDRLEDKFDDRLRDMDAKIEKLEELVGKQESFNSRLGAYISMASVILTLAINYVWSRLTER